LDRPAGSDEKDTPLATDGVIEIHPSEGWFPSGVDTVAGAINALVAAAPELGYIAVQAYLDRLDDASAALLRPELARRAFLQTTFGWGPRFLHSTGQYHKGGPKRGRFLQLLHDSRPDVSIPGAPYTFTTLKNAQAIGDLTTLRELGLPAERLRLPGEDPAAALRGITAKIKEMT
jgi:glucose-6-phosphate isomerase